jgi:starvation-inducible DNA-binding protein
MSPDLGIDDKDRASVITMLNALLADEYVLYTKTRNYHWNVVGPQFNDLHKFFGEQYGAIDEFVDDSAERARTLGGHSVATLGGSWIPRG